MQYTIAILNISASFTASCLHSKDAVVPTRNPIIIMLHLARGPDIEGWILMRGLMITYHTSH